MIYYFDNADGTITYRYTDAQGNTFGDFRVTPALKVDAEGNNISVMSDVVETYPLYSQLHDNTPAAHDYSPELAGFQFEFVKQEP